MAESRLWFLDRHAFLSCSCSFGAWKDLRQDTARRRVRFEKCRGLIRRAWYRLEASCFRGWVLAFEAARVVGAQWRMICLVLAPAHNFSMFLSRICKDRQKRREALTQSWKSGVSCLAKYISNWVEFTGSKRKFRKLSKSICEKSTKKFLRGAFTCWIFSLHLSSRRRIIEQSIQHNCQDMLRSSFLLWSCSHLQLSLKIIKWSTRLLLSRDGLLKFFQRWRNLLTCADLRDAFLFRWSRKRDSFISFRAFLTWKLVIGDQLRKHQRQQWDRVQSLQLIMFSCWRLFATSSKSDRTVIANFQTSLAKHESASIFLSWKRCIPKFTFNSIEDSN
eukprot:753622-Hanusia_phi.AAC.2